MHTQAVYFVATVYCELMIINRDMMIPSL